MPPACKVKELDHKFLLIGKSRFQLCASTIKIMPVTASLYVFFSLSRPVLFNNEPVKIPNKPVLIAGMVESSPSGSCMLIFVFGYGTYKWPGKKVRSTYDAKFPCGVRSPA